MLWFFRFGLLVCLIGVFFIRSVPTLFGKPLLVACDVGQGDAILLTVGSFQLLMDAGVDYSVMDCLEKYVPAGDTRLEIVIASHADSDHIGGFNAVFSLYSIGEVWIVPYSKKTTEFEHFSELISRKQEQGTKLRFLQQGDILKPHDLITTTVLAPRVEEQLYTSISTMKSETTLSDVLRAVESNQEWENSRSIVLKIRYRGIGIVLTGDMEKENEQAVLSSHLIDDINILKVAHHGSKTSTTQAFLEKARPEIAVISCGKNNSYGHPSPEVLDILGQFGVKIRRTDKEGDVVIDLSEEKWIKEGNK